MNFSHFGLFVLQSRLVLMRFGWSKCIASTLCIAGLTAWLWGIPNLSLQQRVQRQSWLSVQQADEVSISVERHTTAEENFTRFTGVLGSPLDTEKQIKTLFALARSTGLTLSQAEYKLYDDKNGHYRTYQILLPVKGSYSAIRKFCEKSLLAIPFSSLDEMSFKRETIASGTLEARLRITLYLSESSTTAMNIDKQHFSSQKEAS